MRASMSWHPSNLRGFAGSNGAHVSMKIVAAKNNSGTQHSFATQTLEPLRVLRATEIQTGPKTYLESCNLSRLQTVEPDEVVVFTLAAIPQRLRRFQRCRGVDVGVIGT